MRGLRNRDLLTVYGKLELAFFLAHRSAALGASIVRNPGTARLARWIDRLIVFIASGQQEHFLAANANHTPSVDPGGVKSSTESPVPK